MESAVATVIAAPAAVIVPETTAPVTAVIVRDPFYKSPFAIDASLVQFTMKPNGPGKGAAGPVDTKTFSISMRPPPGAAAVPAVSSPPPKRAGGRGGAQAPGGPQKPSHLALKPVSALRTKYGISIASKDPAMIAHLRENPRHVNAMAAGIRPTPPDVHFEILFFLDLNNEADRRLEELSDQTRDAFMQYLWSGAAPGVNASRNLIVNGFVRTSEKTDERYIVCSMSTMHTVGQNKFYPTPFYSQTSDSILWSDLVQHNFFAEIEFKVNHVVLVGTGRAAFKSYISSCKLIEVPKSALSAERQGQEAYAEKMKAAVAKADAEAAACGSPSSAHAASDTAEDRDPADQDDLAIQLAELQLKAREAQVALPPAPLRVRKIKPPVPTMPTPTATAVAAPTVVKLKKKAAAAAAPPPPAADDEDVDDDTDVVPDGLVVNVTRAH